MAVTSYLFQMQPLPLLIIYTPLIKALVFTRALFLVAEKSGYGRIINKSSKNSINIIDKKIVDVIF